MKINVYVMDSFAKTTGGGNPAGVVLNAETLLEAEMRKIASVLGFSETAFVSESAAADFKVRFFTPTEEVDLCGHATIGAFYAMSSLNLLPKGKYSQQTKAGILEIEILSDDFVLMEQSVPIFSQVVDRAEVADSLNINTSDISANLFPQVVSTGLRDIIVPIQNIGTIDKIKPDMKKIQELSGKHNAIGYHVFSLSSIHGADAYCRNFAPLYGIPEESASGTSNGALACYLYRYGLVDEVKAASLVFAQGYSMKKPSEVRASLTVRANKILAVKIGGSAMNLRQVEIEL